MKRAPIYHDEHKSFRICSTANGQWQFQACYGKSLKDYDAWRPMARPADYATAKTQLETRVLGA